jgi:hypothetical protein
MKRACICDEVGHLLLQPVSTFFHPPGRAGCSGGARSAALPRARVSLDRRARKPTRVG